MQLRIDHKIGDNDQFSARYLFDDQKDPFGGGITFPGFGTANNNTYQNLLLNETHIFSSVGPTKHASLTTVSSSIFRRIPMIHSG